MRCAVILALSSATWAQNINPGFKIGAPINNPGDRYFRDNTQQGRWTGGPSLEVGLPKNFAVELNALFRTQQESVSYPFTFGPNTNALLFNSNTRLNSWDLPLMLKYRFKIGPARPFVSGGIVFTHQNRKGFASSTCTGPQGSCQPPEGPGAVLAGRWFDSTEWRRGAIVGSGLEFKTRYVTIAPEVRVQRMREGGGPLDYRVTGLVGFTFGKR